jgi:hypothetical protein
MLKKSPYKYQHNVIVGWCNLSHRVVDMYLIEET